MALVIILGALEAAFGVMKVRTPSAVRFTPGKEQRIFRVCIMVM